MPQIVRQRLNVDAGYGEFLGSRPGGRPARLRARAERSELASPPQAPDPGRGRL